MVVNVSIILHQGLSLLVVVDVSIILHHGWSLSVVVNVSIILHLYKSLSVVTSLLVVSVSVYLHLREENLMVDDVGDAALLLLVDRELEVSWSLDPRASHIELAVSEDLIVLLL